MADLDDTPRRCPVHGQPMVRGRQNEDGEFDWVCACTYGVAVLAGPDPARDRRRDLYADRERRRAARALDRWLEATYPLAGGGASAEAISVAGERFVEAVGDYVLARLKDTSCANDCDHPWHQPTGLRVADEPPVSHVHQKADYGVRPYACDGERRGICSGGPAHHPECDSAHQDVSEPGSTGPSYGAGPGEGR